MNKELLSLLKCRKAEAHLEMYLAKYVRDNEKGFFEYINNKSKIMDNMGLLLNGDGTLVTKDIELLNAFFA